MKFDHIVNYNGTYYDAGEEVPIDKEKKETKPSEEKQIPSESKEMTQKKQQNKE